MFWDRVAWVYDVFANGINRRANRAMCAAVAAHIGPEDEVFVNFRFVLKKALELCKDNGLR